MKYPHFRPCAGTEREYSIIAVYAIITHKSRNAKLFLQNFAEKVIYLTFDAGYENGCTAAILDALKRTMDSAASGIVQYFYIV